MHLPDRDPGRRAGRSVPRQRPGARPRTAGLSRSEAVSRALSSRRTTTAEPLRAPSGAGTVRKVSRPAFTYAAAGPNGVVGPGTVYKPRCHVIRLRTAGPDPLSLQVAG